MNALFTTDTLIWAAQIALASVFLYAAFSKVFMRRSAPAGTSALLFACDGLPCLFAQFLAVLEVAGALCLLVPFDVWPAYLLPRVAASFLALLIVVTGAHHVRHKQPTAPIVAVFFLALLVIVGRWP